MGNNPNPGGGSDTTPIGMDYVPEVAAAAPPPDTAYGSTPDSSSSTTPIGMDITSSGGKTGTSGATRIMVTNQGGSTVGASTVITMSAAVLSGLLGAPIPPKSLGNITIAIWTS